MDELTVMFRDMAKDIKDSSDSMETKERKKLSNGFFHPVTVFGFIVRPAGVWNQSRIKVL